MNKNHQNHLALSLLCALFATLPVLAPFEGEERVSEQNEKSLQAYEQHKQEEHQRLNATATADRELEHVHSKLVQKIKELQKNKVKEYSTEMYNARGDHYDQIRNIVSDRYNTLKKLEQNPEFMRKAAEKAKASLTIDTTDPKYKNEYEEAYQKALDQEPLVAQAKEARDKAFMARLSAEKIFSMELTKGNDAILKAEAKQKDNIQKYYMDHTNQTNPVSAKASTSKYIDNVKTLDSKIQEVLTNFFNELPENHDPLKRNYSLPKELTFNDINKAINKLDSMPDGTSSGLLLTQLEEMLKQSKQIALTRVKEVIEAENSAKYGKPFQLGRQVNIPERFSSEYQMALAGKL